jgi:rubredoxin
MRYICQLCGYVYKVEKDDPDNGVEPGTEFEDIDSQWTCPLCGAGTDDFEAETVEDDDYE